MSASPISSVCLSAMRSPRVFSNPLHVEPKWPRPLSLPPLPTRWLVRRNTSNVSRKLNPATREIELRAKRHSGNASGARNSERPAASTGRETRARQQSSGRPMGLAVFFTAQPDETSKPAAIFLMASGVRRPAPQPLFCKVSARPGRNRVAVAAAASGRIPSQSYCSGVSSSWLPS